MWERHDNARSVGRYRLQLIGNYIDDVVFEVVSGSFLHKILKKYYGLSIRDAFKIGYDKDVSVQNSIAEVALSFHDVDCFYYHRNHSLYNAGREIA